jgi:GAF domain-containing protein
MLNRDHELSGVTSELPLFGFNDRPGDVRLVQTGILRAAMAQFGSDVCTLFAYNPVTGQYIGPPAIAGTLLCPDADFAPPRPEGITRKALSHRTLLVPDVSLKADYASEFTQRERILSFMATSLRMSNRTHPFAVLYIDFRQIRSFSTEDEARLAKFADTGAALLQASWLLERYTKVIEIGQYVNESLNTVDNLFARLNNRLGEIVDAKHSFLLAVTVAPERVDVIYSLKGEPRFRRKEQVTPAWQNILDSSEATSVPELQKGDPVLPKWDDSFAGARSGVFVPLRLRGKALGLVAVMSPDPSAYDEQDIHVLAILANHIATALNSIRVFQNFDRLSSTGQRLAGYLEAEDIGQKLADDIRQVTDAEVVILYPYREDKFELPPILSGTLNQPEVPQPAASRWDDTPSRVISRLEPLFLIDASKLSQALSIDRVSHFQRREKVRSLAALPLRVGGETVGVLFLNFRSPQSFPGAQRRLFKALGAFGAIAIKNAEKFTKQAKRRSREQEIIQRIDRDLSKKATLTDVLQAILDGANKEIGAEAGAIMLADNTHTMLSAVAAIGAHTKVQPWKQPINSDKGIVRWVFEHRIPVRVNDVRNDPVWSERFIDDGSGSNCELDVPLVDDSEEGKLEAIGVINFESPRLGAFTPEHETFIQTVANQVVLGIKKAQLYDETLARRDELEQLREFANAIATHLEMSALLDAALQNAVSLTRATAGALLLDVDGKLTVKSVWGLSRDLIGSKPALQNESLIATAARDRRPFIAKPADVTEPERLLFTGMRSAIVAPLVDDQTVWGVLLVGTSDDTPPPLNVDLATAITDLTVMALQNAERFTQAKVERDRLDALQKMTTEMLEKWENTGQLLHSMTRYALKLTSATRADLDVYLYDRPVRSYRCYRTHDGRVSDVDVEEIVEEIDLTDAPPERGIVAHVKETGQAYRTKTDTRYDPHYQGDPNVHSELAVPLAIDDNVFGILNVESTEVGAFDETDEELLKLFGVEARIAFAIARANDRANRELQRFTALFDVGQRLAELGADQKTEAFEIVCEEAAKQCKCLAVLRVLDLTTSRLVLVWSSGQTAVKPFPEIPLDKGLNGMVYRTKKTQRIPDLRNPPSWAPTIEPSDTEARSLMVAPVYVRDDEKYGSLGMSHREPNHFDEADEQLITGLARLLSVTFHRMESLSREAALIERAKQSDIIGSIGEAAWEVAHRLGNDLGRIRTHVNMARRELNRGDKISVIAKLDTIKSEVIHVLSMSQRLKETGSTLGGGTPAMINLGDVVTGVDELNKAPVGVVLNDYRAELTKLPRVYADPVHVTSIIGHLSQNAFEAMDNHGHLTITGSTEGSQITIDIADDGPGIAEEHRSRVFKFMYSTKMNGSGYGLWSALRKAQANRGDLCLHTTSTTAPTGTTFRLTLPRVE